MNGEISTWMSSNHDFSCTVFVKHCAVVNLKEKCPKFRSHFEKVKFRKDSIMKMCI